MKKLIIFSLIVAGMYFTTNAQWQPQNLLPQGNHLSAVFFVSSEKGWTVGELGTILKTNDGGDNWDIVYIDSHNKLNALYFISEQTGFAVGDDGLILTTKDGGQTWDEQTFDDYYNDLYSIYFSSSTVGWIGGEYNTLLKTTDAGETWEKQNTGVFCEPYSIHFSSETHGWLTGTAGDGNIVHTTDGGETWEAKFVDHRMYYSIWSVSDTVAYVALNFSEIMSTTNGGETWQKQTVKHNGCDIHFTSLCFTSDSVGWLVGQIYGNEAGLGIILKTTNAGQDWIVVKDDIRYSLNSVCFIDENTGWIVGNNGLIMQTFDAGLTWHEQSDVLESFMDNFRNIDFVSPLTGWASGMNVLIHTTDGGHNWYRQSIDTNLEITTHEFVTENVGWLGCWNGSILKTEDGGQTWQEKYSDNNDNYLTSIYFQDDNTGWALTNQYLLKTIDGGEKWEEITVDSSEYFYMTSVFFANENFGWILQDFGSTVFRTTNGGLDWDRIDIPVNTEIVPCEFSLNSVFFINENTGWIVGAGSIILKSTDGGLTWEEQRNTNDWTEDLYSVCFVSESTGWAVGREGLILNTTDGGQTWNKELSHTNKHLYDVTFFSENASWTCGSWGTILSRFDGSPNTLEIYQPETLLVRFALSQNYPNPFSTSTTIKIDLQKATELTLCVFDFEGRIVEILARGYYGAGRHEISWFPGALPDGIYICKLQTNGFQESSKLILIR